MKLCNANVSNSQQTARKIKAIKYLWGKFSAFK